MNLLIGLAFAAVATASTTSSLARFVDHNRVLVVSAPAQSDAKLSEQDRNLAGFTRGMADRDLVVVHVVGTTETDTFKEGLDAKSVRQFIGLPPDHFGVALIGKDGRVKLRRTTPVAVTPFSRRSTPCRCGGKRLAIAALRQQSGRTRRLKQPIEPNYGAGRSTILAVNGLKSQFALAHLRHQAAAR